ncbi:MAG: flagellar protein FlaG [Pyrinomonadaceae bacterium]
MSTDAIGGLSPSGSIGFVSPVNRVAAVERTAPEPVKHNAAAPAQPEGGRQESAQDLERTLRALEEAVKPSDISLKFSHDDQTGSIVIEMIDQTSGEQVRQIPTEAALSIAAALGKLQGIVFSRKA